MDERRGAEPPGISTASSNGSRALAKLEHRRVDVVLGLREELEPLLAGRPETELVTADRATVLGYAAVAKPFHAEHRALV